MSGQTVPLLFRTSVYAAKRGKQCEYPIIVDNALRYR